MIKTNLFDEVMLAESRQVYDGLLKRLPPKLADVLRVKILKEENEFIDAMRSAVPSMDVKFWATDSCKKCYGRGVVGTRDSQPVVCTCAKKDFHQWLQLFRIWYNDLKRISEGHNGQTATDDRS